MKVTIILTSYNHEKYIKESIESVLNQTYRDFQLIILDDCSADSSWDIIQQYDDPRIIKVRNNVNKVWVIKDMIDNYDLEGDYIAIHHSDDIWQPDKLQKQVEFLDTHPEYAAVFTGVDVIDEYGEAYENEEGFYYGLFTTENRSRHEWLRHFFYEGNCLCHPSVMVRKKIYHEVYPFIEGLYQIADMMMWVLICQRYDIYILQEKLVKFRIQNRERNTSGMRVDTQIRSSIELFLMLKYYLNIREKEEFLMIFPEAEPYCSGELFIPEYAFAQLCLNIEGQAYIKLFGILLLFDLINNKEKADILAKQYQYSGKAFVKQISSKDVFKVLPEYYEQTASIYFSENNELNLYKQYKYNYVQNEYDFYFEFDIDRPIDNIRFDPCEGIAVKCIIKEARIGEKPMKLEAANSFDQSAGYDTFINADPIYNIKLEKGTSGHVLLRGKIVRLTYAEVNSYIEKCIFNLREKQCENDILIKQKEEAENISKDIHEKNISLQSINAALQDRQQGYEDKVRVLEVSLEEIRSEKNQLIAHAEEMKSTIEKMQGAIEKMQGTIEEKNENERRLNEIIETLKEREGELIKLKSTRWYRIYLIYISLKEKFKRRK